MLVSLVIAGAYLAFSLSDAFLVGALTDDGVYTVLGKALADGAGYHSLYLVGQPVQVKYPPGFPAILSVLWWIGGSVGAVQRLVGFIHPLVVGAVGGLLWWIGRTRFNAPRGLLLLAVVTPLLFDAAIQYYTIPLSEPWYMLAWCLVLLLWLEARAAGPGTKRAWLVGALGIGIAATILIRSQGLVLVSGIVLLVLDRRLSWRERLLGCACCLLPLAAWQIYHHALAARGPVSDLPDEVSYIKWFAAGSDGLSAVLAIVWQNTLAYVGMFGPYLSSHRPLGKLLSGLALGLVSVGTILCLRREPFLALSVLGNFALLLLWPFAQDRLLLSALPFAGLAGAAALREYLGRARPPVRRAWSLAAGGAAFLVVFHQQDVQAEAIATAYAARPARIPLTTRYLLQSSRFIGVVTNWVLYHTSPADRIMTDGDVGVYLYSGRATVPANPTESRLEKSVFAVPGRYLAQRLVNDSVTYLIIGQLGGKIETDLRAVDARCPALLQKQDVGAYVYPQIYRAAADRSCLAPFLEADH